MPSSGESWKQFKLLKPLGRGGMGEVFLAEDGTLNRKVALKFLPEPLQQDDAARERLLREAQAAAALDHPYICKIYEIGEVDGKSFIAMEYIEGMTAQEKLRGGPLPLTELLQVSIEIGEAVDAAHKKQIVHRDLKTANVMITPDGHVKVMDFGLAKQVAMEGQDSKVETLSANLTEGGTTLGTVVYMSPEQVRGDPLDTRSDIFSLGVLLYELATGMVPFQGATSGLTYDAILNRGATPPRKLNREVPAEFEQIIQKALEKDRENRYQTVKELVVDLKRLRRDSGTDTPPFEESSFARPRAKSGATRWVAAAAVLAVAIMGWFFLRPSGSDVVGEAQPITSLAVLPFENPRNDPDVDYLSDGIAESLINQLSELPQLSVMARSTAFRYRGTDVDPQTIGKELGVGAVLMGRVVQQSNTLNVQAELVDTAKGTQIWGQQYEHELDDLLTVQNELASEITRALRLELTGDEQEQVATTGTAVSEAYQSYLRGSFLLAKRTNEDFKQAIVHFEEARVHDPDYALAFSGLADSYFLLGARFYGVDADYPPADAIAQARASALEALRLDPELAEPRATLGFIRFAYDWDWEGAESNFLAAIDLDPDYAQGHQWYSLYLSSVGRNDESLEHARQAVVLEPSSALFNRGLASAYYVAGRYPEAIEELEKTLALDPSFPYGQEWLADVYWLAGEKEKSVVTAQAFDVNFGRFYRLAAEGRFDEARVAFTTMPEELQRGRGVLRRLLVGDTDLVFRTLEDWVERRDPTMGVLFNMPLSNLLRSDPRLTAIRERMGLPE